MDFKTTLNLPKTNFSMKANLPKEEPNTLKFWYDIDLNKKSCIKNTRITKNLFYMMDHHMLMEIYILGQHIIRY